MPTFVFVNVRNIKDICCRKYLCVCVCLYLLHEGLLVADQEIRPCGSHPDGYLGGRVHRHAGGALTVLLPPHLVLLFDGQHPYVQTVHMNHIQATVCVLTT